MKSVLVVVPTTYVWPAHIIPWADYKGATKSLLSSGQVTEMIVSLLVAAGKDPATHDAQVEDLQPDENDNTTVEIEDLWLMKTTVTMKTIFTIKWIWLNSVYVKSLI